MIEIIPCGPGEVNWGKAVIKLQIVEGEQRRSSGKGFELLGGRGGGSLVEKKFEKAVLKRLALPISCSCNQ